MDVLAGRTPTGTVGSVSTHHVLRVAGALLTLALVVNCGAGPQAPTPPDPRSVVPLPVAVLPVDPSLPGLLEGRHSTREYRLDPISPEALAGLLWAGYGRQSDGGRTVPSAGGIHPMELHVLAGDVSGLVPGVYAYDPDAHQLVLHRNGDLRAELMAACLDQSAVGSAPVVIVVAGNPELLRARYGDRSDRYTLLEAGHIGQNLMLAAQSLDLGLVTIGAFDDDAVAGIVGLPEGRQPYYVVPVGHPVLPS